MIRYIKLFIKCLALAMLPRCVKRFIFNEVGKNYPGQFVSMEWSIRNMKKLGFEPQYILDIGAYEGVWTRMVKNIYPKAKFYMIEPQINKEIYLKDLSMKYPDSIFYSLSLLGAETNKKVQFFEMESGSSIFKENSHFPRTTVIKEMITLDDFIEQIKWQKVDFIKLDTQGYELEILKGGTRTLQSVECILMEVSLIGILQDAPLLNEAISYMANLGFVAYDICGFTRRVLDQALWQIDIIFIKKTSRLLENKSYGI